MITRRAALLSMGAALAAQASDADGWRVWSPRPEIAPKAERGAAGELILRGGGNAAVNGAWEREFPGMTPGEWRRLTVKYAGKGLDFAPRQVVARLDWLDASGKRAGQPDYAYAVKSEGEWSAFTLDAPVPPGADRAKVQLMLLEAPRAEVRWKDVKIEKIDAPQPRTVKISTLRLRPKGEDPVGRFIELAERDVPPGTDIILLPEGISVVGTRLKYADAAEPLDGPVVKRLAALARSKRAWIVAGVYEREGNAVYNTSVLLDREGRLAGKYRKVYIPREEMEGGITAGSSYPVFTTDFGRVGMMICWDVQYADPARAMALAGAELILMPIWGGNETLAKARAIENHLFLASSGYDFPSALIDPDGEALVREERDGTVAVATIDLSKRYVDRWLGHMRGRFHREVRGDASAIPANLR